MPRFLWWNSINVIYLNDQTYVSVLSWTPGYDETKSSCVNIQQRHKMLKCAGIHGIPWIYCAVHLSNEIKHHKKSKNLIISKKEKTHMNQFLISKRLT